jgi:simple sugar transport system ATP-binding protein
MSNASVNSAPDAVRMENISRSFPGVAANSEVQLVVKQAAFHAVIGENGAGKSTLLNILYGRLIPDSGRIFVNGVEITGLLRSPRDAIGLGIGLVSQQNGLIPALTVLDNVLLGVEPVAVAGVIARRHARRRVEEIAGLLHMPGVDLDAPAGSLSVAAQQGIEIVKAFYRGARILLLDEPTATLAPQEADALFGLLHDLNAQGTTILFVTHKLREVFAHSSAVTVLRNGRNAGDFRTADTDANELLFRMIGSGSGGQDLSGGRDLTAPATRSGPLPPELREQAAVLGDVDGPPDPSPAVRRAASPLLQVEDVTVRGARRMVRGARLDVWSGEIVGVAGVDGSGQSELAAAIIGLARPAVGRIFLAGVDISGMGVVERRQRGIAAIAEDRIRGGLVLDFSVAENYLLGHEQDPAWGGGALLDPATIANRAGAMLRRYDVRTGLAGVESPARVLSGGNQQKVVVARALDSDPRLVVACQPTRGLDVKSAAFVHQTLRDVRNRGGAVLLFSLDLDEILELSDRIAVMFHGEIREPIAASAATRERVGALMTGSVEEPAA